jgi:hypothetical protein
MVIDLPRSQFFIGRISMASRDDVAKELVDSANQISNMPKEELAQLAAKLVESGLDVEKLQRLAKLALKASSGASKVHIDGQAYHY